MSPERVVKAGLVLIAIASCWFACGSDFRSAPPEPGPSALDACIEQCRRHK